MRIGLQVPRFTWPDGTEGLGRKLAEIGRTADSAGFDSLWVMDHFFQIAMVGEAEEPMLEGYSALSYLAGVTERVKLGTLVTGVHYRYPGILAKTATTLDVLSGGRAYLGIGAGWYERESAGLGVPFPTTSERFERLEEALQITRQMWSDEVATYEGKHYRLAETLNSPQPVSRPHPPIMIGGSGEKKTLRLVALYADACNLFAYGGPETIRHKLDVLRGHCEDVGRDYEEIEKTALGTANLAPDGMTADDVISMCRELNGAGIQHLIFNMPNVHDIEPLERFGEEVIPAVREF
ncbi:MAG TPA: LLM class F420-dependent oxidoreductase [Rubrobacteraceae bacterium]|nr:LLM class F420-dependent oxidoreductase [Rubrobacteraceae bacterium]